MVTAIVIIVESEIIRIMKVTALARKRSWVMGRSNTRGLAQTCSALAMGSAFFHGSHTRLGSKADNNLIGDIPKETFAIKMIR